MTNPSVEPSQRRSVTSQNERLKQMLEAGCSITSLDALQLFGCARLAARIADLRKQGYVIESEMVTLPNGKRVARYTYYGEFNRG